MNATFLNRFHSRLTIGNNMIIWVIWQIWKIIILGSWNDVGILWHTWAWSTHALVQMVCLVVARCSWTPLWTVGLSLRYLGWILAVEVFIIFRLDAEIGESVVGFMGFNSFLLLIKWWLQEINTWPSPVFKFLLFLFAAKQWYFYL